MTPTPKTRIYGLDLLRGLVMIIMALDHTREFFHFDAYLHNPLDVETTSVALYFTRWITHFCAPIFVFLAGTSIYLQSLRKSNAVLRIFLLKRGLWLVFVEVVVITLALTFDLSYSFVILQVIWAIGISMVFMALILQLPFTAILVGGLVIVFGHNLVDMLPNLPDGFLWDLLRNGNFSMYNLGAGHQLIIVYAFLPWLGLMMLGYCAGKIYEPAFDASLRKRLLIRAGLAIVLFFIVLRYLNIYGDPFKWSPQDTPVFTLLSFLNVHKYPPSLLYLCITIGPALIFLAFFEHSNGKVARAFSVYGRVPFFYYIVHFYVIHFLSTILFLARGHSITEKPDPALPFYFVKVGEGYSLAFVYLIWALLVLSLYPLCKWFSEYKKHHTAEWLSYL